MLSDSLKLAETFSWICRFEFAKVCFSIISHYILFYIRAWHLLVYVGCSLFFFFFKSGLGYVSSIIHYFLLLYYFFLKGDIMEAPANEQMIWRRMCKWCLLTRKMHPINKSKFLCRKFCSLFMCNDMNVVLIK